MSGAAEYVSFAELGRVVGVDDARTLLAALGGGRFYIPRAINPDHRIAKLIGMSQGMVLCRHFSTGIGGLWVELPRGETGMFEAYREQLRALASDASLSEQAIVRRLGVSGRTVRRMRAKLRKENQARQLRAASQA